MTWSKTLLITSIAGLTFFPWPSLLDPAAAATAPSPKVWKNSPICRDDYFPLAVWLQDPINAAKYQQIGINLFVGLWQGPTQEQLDVLKRSGMSVICEQNNVALQNLENKAIIGWMHGDEPDNAQGPRGLGGYGPPIAPEKIVAEYERMRKADETRPILLNLGQGVAWDGWSGRGARTNHPEDYAEYVKGCDVASFDIYPVTHKRPEIASNLWYVSYGVDRLVKWTGGSKNVWACIETTHIANPDALPTAAQVRSEVWLALVHGARGIVYFSHEFKPKFIEAGIFAHPEIAEEVKKTNVQIRELARVLNSQTELEAATVEPSKNEIQISILCKRQGNVLYIFAVSERDGATEGTFKLANLHGDAEIEVIGENRSLKAANGRFEDPFNGYSVHLYRVKQ
jgi:hypothetical protein